MHTEHHKWYSPALGQEMELKVYGHYGQPIVVFPAQNGRWYDWEGHGGMVEACRHLLEAGRIKFICVDGIDWQSWTNTAIPPWERARRHNDYDAYIMGEVVPFVQRNTGLATMWLTGCSMGAFHAANFFFKHPEAFDGVIALSGLYQVGGFVGDEGGMDAYFNSPLWYLANMHDEALLERYRQGKKIVFVVGQGRWEEECIADTRAMERVLAEKRIPAWVEYWGHDVDHDWPWWRRMLPYYLERLGV
ncbi:MAG: alpha/beta hydrolase-fold protein [Meiothermus sp.]|uniref:esterase family protein n=1 Tax=Meiothermus sp. TaxID=1955249 RepID=UPI0025E8FAA8|nr:alpha/beta hydrolase-fold protein [Meiothermus sp.]MCS7058453.1 alpha/beta hydrolase-fold protein [Meiothermus sp.]MCS7193413.1 alpha/beta hydrolase-fold protein [Meiothermus sp.]MCX7740331.1 alpha/beta hydrolase-fold protein [Meiothermus sp.]MDW8090926.1 alpha/beta hydrolase-fold protein [Meiothermus sp.]MDW8482065.1 alpha/beta hydrolase-fold protein [Meiothermus sp.]